MPNSFKLCPTHFSIEEQKNSRGASPSAPPSYGPDYRTLQNNTRLKFPGVTVRPVARFYGLWGENIFRWKMFVFIIYLNKLSGHNKTKLGGTKNFGELPLYAPRIYTPGYYNSDMKEVRPKNRKWQNNLWKFHFKVTKWKNGPTS